MIATWPVVQNYVTHHAHDDDVPTHVLSNVNMHAFRYGHFRITWCSFLHTYKHGVILSTSGCRDPHVRNTDEIHTDVL